MTARLSLLGNRCALRASLPLSGHDQHSKTQRVRLAIDILPELFSKADVLRACPGVSERTGKRTLEELKA